MSAATGQDNDCNGITDDPYLGDLGQPCTAGLGVCETPGHRVCAADGVGTVCDATPPSPTDSEYCNGLDDDCNGQTDEDFPALGQPCTAGLGVCERWGTTVCSGDGYGTECDAVKGTGGQEVCDGLDNDCDGATDNLLGPLCPLQAGVCAGARETCLGAQGWSGCDEALYKAWSQDAYEPREAQCDSKDNDCNGLVDDVDLDGDGHFALACKPTIAWSLQPMADDCDDTPGAGATRHPGAPEACNGVDDDCDGITDEVDGDHDGYVDAGCLTYTGDQALAGDCDDHDSARHPGQLEVCGDVVDNNCSGYADDKDADGDGHVDAACPANQNPAYPADDCRDDLPDAHPGVGEICNSVDDDCDGVVDDVDRDGDGFADGSCGSYAGDPAFGGDCNDDPTAGGNGVHPGAPEVCNGVDDDCDGWMDNKDDDKDGHVDSACLASAIPWPTDDCDDGNPNRHPGLKELCGDGVDNDCSGYVDDKDDDGDGHGDVACVGNTDPSLVLDDCDDGNPMAYSGHMEICGDGVDNDCSGYVDDKDDDGDGHYDGACFWSLDVLLNPEHADDCDDNPTTGDLAHPGLVEVCGDGVDNDCDGAPDNLDEDGDGFVAQACGGQDCDDDPMYGAASNPTATEICDGLDNDCDGNYDDVDLDGDGHIDAPCTGYPGPEPVDDCADLDPTVFPGALEQCGDGIDQDCSGYSDDKDNDLDGHIDASSLCSGYTGGLPQDDCNDEAMESHPGATEGTQPDLLDNDCNGLVDDTTVFAGDVVITELMIDPAAVPDAQGEWIEVYNNTSNTLNLATWTLTDDAGESFDIQAKGGVLVPAGGYAVLCSLAEWDYNGGVLCDVEYAGFSLSNIADTVTLKLGSTVIDTVSYDTGNGWTVPNGASLQLDIAQRDAAANNNPGAWCTSDGSMVLFGGDWATPMTDNVACGGAQPGYLSSVYPNNGVLPGGEPITISGMGLTGATGATIGGQACSSFAVQDDSEITCTTPAGTMAGPVDVVVTHPNGDMSLPNGYTYTEVAVTTDTIIDWCNLQHPSTTMVTSNTPSEPIYGRVHFSDGTVPPANPPGPLRAEVGFGPTQTDPSVTPGWAWTNALHNTNCSDCGENYEYEAQLMPGEVGTFSYAYRFSMDDGISWSYCDLDSSMDGTVQTDQLGTLTVN